MNILQSRIGWVLGHFKKPKSGSIWYGFYTNPSSPTPNVKIIKFKKKKTHFRYFLKHLPQNQIECAKQLKLISHIQMQKANNPYPTSYLVHFSFHTLTLTHFFLVSISTTKPLNMNPLLHPLCFPLTHQLTPILLVSISIIKTPSQLHQINIRCHHFSSTTQLYMSLASLRYVISLP